MERQPTTTEPVAPAEYKVTLQLHAPDTWLGQAEGFASFTWFFITPSELRKLVEEVYEDYGADAHIKVTLGDDVVFDCPVPYCLINLMRAA